MALPKSLRPRWRYLAVEIESWPDADLRADAVQQRIWYAAQDFLGDPGSADVDLSCVRVSVTDGWGEGIVRTRRGEVERSRAVLACVDRIEDHPVRICVRGVSGTIRACEESYLSGATESAERRDVVFKSEHRPAVVRGDAVDVWQDDTFTGATILDTEED